MTHMNNKTEIQLLKEMKILLYKQKNQSCQKYDSAMCVPSAAPRNLIEE